MQTVASLPAVQGEGHSQCKPKNAGLNPIHIEPTGPTQHWQLHILYTGHLSSISLHLVPKRGRTEG